MLTRIALYSKQSPLFPSLSVIRTRLMSGLPETMKAIVVHEPGASDALVVEKEWPLPKLNDGQVMVKVKLGWEGGGGRGERGQVLLEQRLERSESHIA